MAKAFSPAERERVRQTMITVGAELIRRKGIRQVTVEDITTGANIAKGSFYSFYDQRELLFWDIIKQEERRLIEKIQQVAAQDRPLKTKFDKIFYDLVLDEDGLVIHLPAQDLEYIMQKLPPAVIQADRDGAQAIVGHLLALCGLSDTPEHSQLMMAMIQTLQAVASNRRITRQSIRQEMLTILVEAFGDYFQDDKSA